MKEKTQIQTEKKILVKPTNIPAGVRRLLGHRDHDPNLISAIKGSNEKHTAYNLFLKIIVEDNQNPPQKEDKEQLIIFPTKEKKLEEQYKKYAIEKNKKFNQVLKFYSQLSTSQEIKLPEKANFFLYGSFYKDCPSEAKTFSAAVQAFELSRPGFAAELIKINETNTTIEKQIKYFSTELIETQNYYKELLKNAKKEILSQMYPKEGDSQEFTEGQSEEFTQGQSEEFTEGQSEEFTQGQSEEFTEGQSEEFTQGQSEEFTEGQSEEFTEEKSEEFTEEKSKDPKQKFKELCGYYEKTIIKKDYSAKKPKKGDDILPSYYADLDYHARCWVALKQNLQEEVKKLKKALVKLQEEEAELLTIEKETEHNQTTGWYKKLKKSESSSYPGKEKLNKRRQKRKNLSTSKKMAAFNGFSSAAMAVFGFIMLAGSSIALPYLILLSVLLFIPSFLAYYKFTQKDTFAVLNFNYSDLLKRTNSLQKIIIIAIVGSFTFLATAHSFIGMYGFLAHFIAATWLLSLGGLAFGIPTGIFIAIFMLKFTYDLVVHWRKHTSDFLNFMENFYWMPLKVFWKNDSWLTRMGIIFHLLFNLIKHSLGIVFFIIAALLSFENLSPIVSKFMGWFFKPGASLFVPNINYVKAISSSITGISVGYWGIFGIAKIRGLTEEITLRSVCTSIIKFPFYIMEIICIPISFIKYKGLPKKFLFSPVYEKINLFFKKHVRGKTYSNTDSYLLNYVLTELKKGRKKFLQENLVSQANGSLFFEETKSLNHKDSSQEILENLNSMRKCKQVEKEVDRGARDASFVIAAIDNALGLAVVGLETAVLSLILSLVGCSLHTTNTIAIGSIFAARLGTKITPRLQEEEVDLYADEYPIPRKL